MGTLPGRLLRHTVAVEPYAGTSGAGGPVYGPPVTLRCFLDQKTRLVRSASLSEVTSSSTFYCRLTAIATVPAESRVTLPDGRTTTVIQALKRDGGGLPTPDHWEVQLT